MSWCHRKTFKRSYRERSGKDITPGDIYYPVAGKGHLEQINSSVSHKYMHTRQRVSS